MSTTLLVNLQSGDTYSFDNINDTLLGLVERLSDSQGVSLGGNLGSNLLALVECLLAVDGTSAEALDATGQRAVTWRVTHGGRS